MGELLEHAVLDQRVAARGEALAVDVGRRVGERVRRVVDERDERRGDLVAEPVVEQAAPLDDGLAVERRRDDPEELRGHERIEHDGRSACDGGLRGAEQPGRPVGGLASGTVEIELVGRPPDAESESGLGLVVASPSSASVDTLT